MKQYTGRGKGDFVDVVLCPAIMRLKGLKALSFRVN
jgi:hypothetical protein